MRTPSATLASICSGFALGALVLAGIGCDRSETSSTDAPADANAPKTLKAVTLQLNWKPEPQFGGFYTAGLNKAYDRNGLAVTVVPGGAGAPTVEMVGAGTVQFAVVSGDEIVRARANGNKIVGLYAVYQTNPQGIMTRAERGFTELADVFSRPGTLAMERGLPYGEFLAKKYGFDKLRVVPPPFGDLSVYRSDPDYAMQCFVTSEPLAAKKLGIEPQTFLIAESGYNPYTTVLAASEKFVKENPETVKAMVAAVREGWLDYLSDPASTNAVMRELNPTMDAETFAASAEAQKKLIMTPLTHNLGLGAMTLDRWTELVQQLKDLKVVEAEIDPVDCFIAPTE